jgi:Ser-tRNA(Ala) deacylase AlaX
MYLKDTYQFQATAAVEKSFVLDDGRNAIMLDATIFYPQGGGQPCDIGFIKSEQAVFKVTDVRMDKEGNVLHIGSFEQGVLNQGDKVNLEIDQDRRVKNAKMHTAGHLLDCAVSKLGLPLVGTKGYHFPDGPNVEYKGVIDNPDEVMQKIQAAIDELVARDINVVIQELTYEEAQSKGLFVPQGKQGRIISFEGFNGCGCGGTHVPSTGKLGKIVIRKIKTKSGITKISYEVA